MRGRLAVALLVCVCAPDTKASADWLIMPFLGTSFAGETTFLVLEEGAGSRMTLGGSVALIGGGILGHRSRRRATRPGSSKATTRSDSSFRAG